MSPTVKFVFMRDLDEIGISSTLNPEVFTIKQKKLKKYII